MTTEKEIELLRRTRLGPGVARVPGAAVERRKREREIGFVSVEAGPPRPEPEPEAGPEAGPKPEVPEVGEARRRIRRWLEAKLDTFVDEGKSLPPVSDETVDAVLGTFYEAFLAKKPQATVDEFMQALGQVFVLFDEGESFVTLSPEMESIRTTILKFSDESLDDLLAAHDPDVAWSRFLKTDEFKSLPQAARTRLLEQKGAALDAWQQLTLEPAFAEVTFQEFLESAAGSVEPTTGIIGAIEKDAAVTQAHIRRMLLRSLAELGRLPEAPSREYLDEVSRRAAAIGDAYEAEVARAEAEGREPGPVEQFVSQAAAQFPEEQAIVREASDLRTRFELIAGEPIETEQPKDRDVLLARAFDEASRRYQAGLLAVAGQRERLRREEATLAPGEKMTPEQLEAEALRQAFGGKASTFEDIVQEGLAKLPSAEEVRIQTQARFGAVPPVGPEFTRLRRKPTPEELESVKALLPGLDLTSPIGMTAAAAVIEQEQRVKPLLEEEKTRIRAEQTGLAPGEQIPPEDLERIALERARKRAFEGAPTTEAIPDLEQLPSAGEEFEKTAMRLSVEAQRTLQAQQRQQQAEAARAEEEARRAAARSRKPRIRFVE